MFCNYCKKEIVGECIERTGTKGSKEIFKTYYHNDCYIKLQSRVSGAGLGLLTWLIMALFTSILLGFFLRIYFFLGFIFLFGFFLLCALCNLSIHSKPYRLAFKNFKIVKKKFIKAYGITIIVCMVIYLIIIAFIMLLLSSP